jgi:hypothetical protein
VTVFQRIEAAWLGLIIVAYAEEVAGPLGGLRLGVDVMLADEFEEITALTSGVVVPEALLGAGEFDVERVACVAEDVTDDPLRTDLTAGG